MADLWDSFNSDRFASGGALVAPRGSINEAKAVRHHEFANELSTAHRINPPEFVDR